MPTYSTKVQLTSAAKAAGIPLADIEHIAGAFKTYETTADLQASASLAPERFLSGQIVYISSSDELFMMDVVVNPDFTTTVSSASFEFAGEGFPYSGSAVITGSLTVTDLPEQDTTYLV